MIILIKGMDMPKCCTECSCCRHDNWNGETAHQCNVSLITFSAEDENWIYDQRPNWCPLVEIPTPHGRLVDIKSVEDRKFTTVDNEYERWWNGALDSVVDNAPTVIEAEGSEE